MIKPLIAIVDDELDILDLVTINLEKIRYIFYQKNSKE